MNCVVGSEETCKVTGTEQALGQGSRESRLVGTKSTHRLDSPWSSHFTLHLGGWFPTFELPGGVLRGQGCLYSITVCVGSVLLVSTARPELSSHLPTLTA